MELRAFQENGKKKTLVIIGCILSVLLITVVVVMKTYAIYQEQKEYDVIEGSVPEFMDNFDVKVALTIDGSPATTFPEKESGKTVESIVCNKGASATWDYYNWNLVVQNLTETKTKCQVSFVTKYTDSVLNGNDPVLRSELVPVLVKEDGSVYKASLGSKWYDYQDKQWANAVILKDRYQVFKEGELIPESAIESYFVWIPKFQYQIFNMSDYSMVGAVLENHVQQIQVRFDVASTTDTSTSCKTPNKSGDRGTCSIGKWMTHPAFVGEFEGIKGMWVGKFETGNQVLATENNINPSAIQIKPNVESWHSMDLANAFYSSYFYQRNLDSHMMKNTEWGAVAYLTQSQYGVHDVIRLNNRSDFKTGYAAISAVTKEFADYLDYDTAQLWNTSIGVLASTTGNVSGIYDMSGGTWEAVMGVYFTNDQQFITGSSSGLNSGFNGAYYQDCPNLTDCAMKENGLPIPDAKYYDAYQESEKTVSYQMAILGDATGEMGPFSYGNKGHPISSWYTNRAYAIPPEAPFFVRGGDYKEGSNGGIFAFSKLTGGNPRNPGSVEVSFRMVLSP